MTRCLVGVLLAVQVAGCTGTWGPKGNETVTTQCAASLGGARIQRPCEDQFETSSANIKLKGSYLETISAEIGYNKDKLVEVTNETVRAVVWLRDLCADWNACAISDVDYQDRKKKLIAIEDNFYAILAKAEALKDSKSKGPADASALADLGALVDAQRASVARIASEMKSP